MTAKELKTRATEGDVDAFLAAVPDVRRRTDARALSALMTEVTGERPRMWGPSIVGFGVCTYRDGRGTAREWFPLGFSPRKAELVVYLVAGHEAFTDEMARLGPLRTGAACVYLKRLEDVDQDALRALIARAWDERPPLD